MASAFFALLDDVAGMARLAAASLDGVVGTTGRVALKAAAVVVDDAAVTPQAVVGLRPERELPLIGRIALGSLRNKLLVLLPAALALNALAPWAVAPLLALGGLLLCFEGAEKALERGGPHRPGHEASAAGATSEDTERGRVRGAIRTDFVLSAEIMAISLAEVASLPAVTEAVVLILVALATTAGVYGAVAVIVKADDVGLHLARSGPAGLRGLGRGLVASMPPVLAALSAVGAAAMLWVGGGIILHGLAHAGVAAPAETLEALAAAAAAVTGPGGPAAAWLVGAAGSGVAGLAVGTVLVLARAAIRR